VFGGVLGYSLDLLQNGTFQNNAPDVVRVVTGLLFRAEARTGVKVLFRLLA
jgi:hypothetical protein